MFQDIGSEDLENVITTTTTVTKYLPSPSSLTPNSDIVRETKTIRKTEVLHVDTANEPISWVYKCEATIGKRKLKSNWNPLLAIAPCSITVQWILTSWSCVRATRSTFWSSATMAGSLVRISVTATLVPFPETTCDVSTIKCPPKKTLD